MEASVVYRAVSGLFKLHRNTLVLKKPKNKKEHHLVMYTKYTVIMRVTLFHWNFLVKAYNNTNIKMVVL